MQDQFERRIEYLRISITDRCNLRCQYCMPASGVQWIPHKDILTFEEIFRLVKLGTQLGFKRFRLTGGEPLIRKGLVEFISQISQVPGVEDLMLTTNGMLLPDMAFDLKAAGLHRVNISLDTFDPDRFREMTRGGDVNKVLQGISRSLEADLKPVKLNVVVVRDFNLHELPKFLDLARNYPIHVRFIELMPIGVSSEQRNQFVSIAEMKEALGFQGLEPQKKEFGGGPAEYVSPEGFQGRIGFISALSRHFCSTCNRMRLTADGKLRPCLHSPKEIDLRLALRNGSTDQELIHILEQAIWNKPAEHHMNEESWQGSRVMSQIGG